MTPQRNLAISQWLFKGRQIINIITPTTSIPRLESFFLKINVLHIKTKSLYQYQIIERSVVFDYSIIFLSNFEFNSPLISLCNFLGLSTYRICEYHTNFCSLQIFSFSLYCTFLMYYLDLYQNLENYSIKNYFVLHIKTDI